MTVGAHREARRKPLAPPFPADDTQPQEQLVMLLRLARGLRFIREDGGAGGDWGPLLDADETVLLAGVMSGDLDHFRRDFLDAYAAGRPDELERHLILLAEWLSDWIGRLAETSQPRANWTDRHAALAQQRAAALVDSAKRLVSQFGASDPLLGQVMYAEDPAALIRAADISSLEPPERLLELRRLYFALLNAVAHVRDLARDDWTTSMASGVHEPAASLLIALAQVYGQVQARINTFADRLNAFYYDDVLKVAAKPGHPDSAHLILGRDPTFAGAVSVREGDRFAAPRSAAGPAAEFLADTSLRLTDLKVADLRTLRLQRDPLSTCEARLDLVSRARIDALSTTAGPAGETEPRVIPLLGGDAGSALSAGGEARIGLAISSPVLWLKEGERSIRVRLGLGVEPEDLARLARELAKASAETFLPLLGAFLGRWILGETDPLEPRLVQAIGARAVALGLLESDASGPRSPADVIQRLLDLQALTGLEGATLAERRHLLRDALLENVFTAAISVADGWWPIPRPVLEAQSDGAGAGLSLLFHLSNEDPAVTACSPPAHGEDWPSEAPVLQLLVNDGALIYPLSLLRGVTFDHLDIEVRVDGLRDLRAYNQLGPLDASRPFMPFGPLPDLASYLIIAAPEPAKKRLTALTVWPEWAGLPAEGFAAHYAEYDAGLTDKAFTVNLSVLRDGVWQAMGAPQPLFDGREPVGGCPIRFDPTALGSLWRPADVELVLDQNARSGFARLQLAEPAAAFGHQAYPGLLTDSLTAKARGRRKTPTPNPPYTPVLSRLTLSYSAATHIDVGSAVAGSAGTLTERVLHLHPFGAELIHPTPADTQYAVVPDYPQDGHLFIGLAGGAPSGPVTLLFDLHKDLAVEAVARRRPRPRPVWSWLAADGWRALEDRRVLSDSTSGFLATGLVSLDLPPGMSCDNPMMPKGLYWLRLSCDGSSEAFAGLRGVAAGGVRVTRAPAEPLPDAPLPAGSLTMKSQAIAGVTSVDQPKPGFGLRTEESPDDRRIRIGERLRHKNRASTAWDFERLVLERFPEVDKVRCLPNCAEGVAGRAPGQVMVVVAPAGRRSDARYASRALRLDPLELGRIEDFLRERASQAATVRVRNAAYELIQARARVLLRSDADLGESLQRVNAAIAAHLSPWSDDGCCPGFDWRVRGDDIEDCLRRLPEVAAVNGISLIHVWSDESRRPGGFHSFEDTADPEFSAGRMSDVEIAARLPWSLALPAEQHLVDVTREGEQSRPNPTGIAAGDGSLAASVAGVQLGSTFVIRGSRQDSPAPQPVQSEEP